MDGSPAYTIYWQPGCSSCLKAKEFLFRHGIPFRSVNVHASEVGRGELLALGARSVPVVARDDGFVSAQNLDELAEFLGVETPREKLTVPALARRTSRVMDVGLALVNRLPDTSLDDQLRKDRTVRDLAYHVFAIAVGFLDAARGGQLTEAHFYRVPDPSATRGQLLEFGAGVQRDFEAWWAEVAEGPWPQQLATYYGNQDLQPLLERTCWHMVQHCRQLETIVSRVAGSFSGGLTPQDLHGLPLPEHVWDDQVELPQPGSARST